MTDPRYFLPVEPHLVGDNAPSVRPGDDPAFFGTAELTPSTPVEARSFQTFRLSYRVGQIGLDDSGGLRIGFRRVSDVGKLQAQDPTAPNYVSATCSGAGKISLTIGMHGQRPWDFSVTAQLSGGYLSEGDEITLILGDTSHGSPGMQMQTFAEGGFEFRVMADVQATGNFVPLNQQFTVPVVAGPPHKWVAVLPTLRRPGEPFHLGLKAEDLWGNPTDQAKGQVTLQPTLPIANLPTSFDYAPTDRAMVFDALTIDSPGTLWVDVLVDGVPVAQAGPLVIAAGDHAGFWGDLHGQTGETVGVNTIESYFDFARNKAFLDVSAHQGNDFQINAAFWDKLNRTTAEWNEPGRFTVLPGYEWSGNTAVGGDHNVFYAQEGRPIYRCSHALLEDRSEMHRDTTTLTDLYSALRDEDAVVYAHVGGRYANIHYDHDPVLETAVEMHSAWGTFEWILTDGFPLGRRVGVVCNSDGHKGRPGASYPGASTFGSFGGLTCFLTDRNDRPAIIEAQRRRHHYGTTGCRMHMSVTADLPPGSVIADRNPAAVPDTPRHPAHQAMMGDIVETDATHTTVSVALAAHAGILRVELRRGAEVIETLRPYTQDDLGNRIRVIWSGAEYRGRGRNSIWRGHARFANARIDRFATINKWNPECQLDRLGSDSVVFDTITTGNFMGFDAWLDPDTQDPNSSLQLRTNRISADLSLSDIGLGRRTYDAGGLARQITAQRLPDAPLPREMSFQRQITLTPGTDDPIWIAVTTEDGYQAWSSPIYFI